MKAILMSIQPKWCELIASGKKTIEVRKTAPTCGIPFKVYMYCTKAKEHFSIGGGVYATSDTLYKLPTGEIEFGDGFELMCDWSGQYNEDNFLNGKVIGEFVCDKLVWVISHPDVFAGHPCYHAKAIEDACMGKDEAEAYSGGADLYGYHISDLVIYDKPRELAEFKKPCKTIVEYEGEICSDCLNCDWCIDDDYGMRCDRSITRPPQS